MAKKKTDSCVGKTGDAIKRCHPERSAEARAETSRRRRGA